MCALHGDIKPHMHYMQGCPIISDQTWSTWSTFERPQLQHTHNTRGHIINIMLVLASHVFGPGYPLRSYETLHVLLVYLLICFVIDEYSHVVYICSLCFIQLLVDQFVVDLSVPLICCRDPILWQDMCSTWSTVEHPQFQHIELLTLHAFCTGCPLWSSEKLYTFLQVRFGTRTSLN